ncbi:sodium-dependent transporter [Allosphingosinicella indica]|uniref:Transporter n=1 Tax=Allosphingosinicella indica TaxID=941907 RepID=A0A1X7FYB4_9SPHN|nr:sodium-dependent transporter [Allosphingosinicella indica]SMF60933.1 neurotransmitter:Na+ symporter, NSS family [Allosphingosinicella indica]
MNKASDKVAGEVWTSKLAFLFATAAAAIGLGSLWRFPYVAGANGGGAFVLLYILFVLVICVPIMIGEMAMGRRGHGSVIGSMNRLIRAEGAWSGWRAIGWLSIAIPFFGLSYYSVVAGWGVDYARLAIVRGFAGIDATGSRGVFEELIGSPWRQAAFQFAFIAGVAIVVALGVRRGIEFVSKIKMVALFVVLIGLVLYNAVTVGLGPSLTFLFYPDFSALTGAGVLTALGQALFSTAIGVGVLMTYSAYLPKGVSLPQSAAIVSGSVIFIAMMAGLAIFPSVLFYGLEPTEGPNLIFVTLPVAFGGMPGGRIVSIAFFSLIALGAFTTAVGMLEPVVAWLMERTGLPRARLSYLTALAIFGVGLPSTLSFNLLKDVHPLGFLPPFAGKTFFDVLDFGIADLLLPLNALLLALFAGWAIRRTITPVETDLSPSAFRIWHLTVAIVAPVAIVGLMIHILA